jgi:hypothetical protein
MGDAIYTNNFMNQNKLRQHFMHVILVIGLKNKSVGAAKIILRRIWPQWSRYLVRVVEAQTLKPRSIYLPLFWRFTIPGEVFAMCLRYGHASLVPRHA